MSEILTQPARNSIDYNTASGTVVDSPVRAEATGLSRLCWRITEQNTSGFCVVRDEHWRTKRKFLGRTFNQNCYSSWTVKKGFSKANVCCSTFKAIKSYTRNKSYLTFRCEGVWGEIYISFRSCTLRLLLLPNLATAQRYNEQLRPSILQRDSCEKPFHAVLFPLRSMLRKSRWRCSWEANERRKF